jgi:hypothetical protein
MILTLKSRFLAACTAATLSLGVVTMTPAVAETMSAHQASKMMRHHHPTMMHHRSRMMYHKRMMMHHKRMMHRSMR